MDPTGTLASYSKAGFVAASDGPDTADEPLAVHGVALPESVEIGGKNKEETKTTFPPDVLEEAADLLEGRKIVDDSEHDDLEALNPPNSAVVGEVTETAYREGVGVMYAGEIAREPERSLVENGYVEVSPAVFRELDGEDGDDSRNATGIGWWRDLAVVPHGAAPGNSIQPGTTALAAEAAAEAFGDTDGDRRARAARTDNHRSREESGKMGDTDSDLGPDPEELKRLREENRELRSKLEELRDELEAIKKDGENDLEARIEELEAQNETLESENDDLNQQVEPVEEQAVEAMSDHTGLDENVVREKFGLGEMLDTLTGEDGDTSTADIFSLDPDPASSDSDPTGSLGGGGGGNGSGGLLAMSDDERTEVRSKLKRAETFDGVNDSHAESLRSEAAEMAGVESHEEIEGAV